MNRIALLAAGLVAIAVAGPAQAQSGFTAPDPDIDRLVDRCLVSKGVTYFEDDRTICYNAAIFPEEFLQLQDFPPAEQIVITSPGGNVATARLMSKILDDRGEPAIIAGQCMSACAMVLLPGLDSFHVHRSAHIAVHGITMMDYKTWWGWLRDGAEPTAMAMMAAQMGYDFGYIMHASGKDHMEGHLEGQKVDQDYIQTVSDRMLADALAHECRVDPKDYWGMLDAEHLQTYLSERISGMEAFAQTWEDPNNKVYKAITTPIGSQTYIFKRNYETAECD